MSFLLDVIKNRNLIIGLSISDFKKKFAGSFFGVIWMFVQPMATVLVYTLIFQVGFRAVPPVPNVPYVVWLIAGIVPWFYFQETIIQNTNCLIEYNYLVKKVVFNVSFLPITKLISTTLSHFCFLIITFFVMIVFGIEVTPHWFLVFYYSFMLCILMLGLSYIVSSINVYFRDMGQIVSILLQFGIWMCPIMYDESLFIGRDLLIIKFFKLNPLYYIITGYRYSLIGQKLNYDFLILSIYYIIVSILILFFGFKLFNKLKEQFADVI